MRNTPYPRYTIGNRDHEIFDLDPKPGLIQGIVTLHETKEVKVADILQFEHLRPGETKSFEASERIEIVSFGGYSARYGFLSSLETQVIDLEAGSKLTGPMAWRIRDKSAPIGAASELSKFDTAYAVLALGFLLFLWGLLSLLSIWAALSTIGVCVFAALLVFLIGMFEQRRTRSIERLGSVYILAPGSRTWAGGGAQPQA